MIILKLDHHTSASSTHFFCFVTMPPLIVLSLSIKGLFWILMIFIAAETRTYVPV